MIPGLDFLPTAIAIPTVLIVVVGLLFIVLMFALVIFGAFASKIPFVWQQFVAQVKKRPGIFLHTINKQIHFYAPKRAGAREERNYLDIAKAIGSYWVPDSKHIEHFERLPVSNYFSKCSVSLPPEKAKAACDFYDFMGKKGYHVNEELIDVMVVHGCEVEDVYLPALWEVVKTQLPLKVDNGELTPEQQEKIETLEDEIFKIDAEIGKLKANKAKLYYDIDNIAGYIDQETGEKIDTIKSLAAELKETIVKDGLFVFQQVQDLAMSVAKVNSANTSETIAIANAEALNNADKGKSAKDYGTLIIFGIFLLAGLAIVYRIMVGN